MPNINFTTSKGTKYILNFDQLDTPENIEVSFQTKEKGFEATNKGEVFEVMQIITGKIKQFLEKFKEKAPENIKFLITNGLGHNKIYKTPEIVDQIVAFLSA